MARAKKVELAHGQDIRSRIKEEARHQMAVHGTAGISLRAIARELGVTAPAIYNYFPRLDDLITALVVDSFTAQGDAMLAARDSAHEKGLAVQISQMLLTYRQWAIDHPTDFQLIYGNPIPGYEAPADITVPLAVRPFTALMQLFYAAWQTGMVKLPLEYAAIPHSIAQHMTQVKHHLHVESMPDALYTLLIAGWSRIHGMVMLELYGHLEPVIGDPAIFYRYEVQAFMQRMGFAMT